MRARAVRLASLAGFLVLGSGCYTYAPSPAAPASGSDVVISLTDRGRFLLTDRVGPEMDKLRGRITSTSDSTLVLSMIESTSLRGFTAKWTDEVIVLNRDQINSVRTRTFSRGRSWILAGAGTAAAVLAVSGGINAFGETVTTEPGKAPTLPGQISKIGTFSIPFRSDF